MDVSTLLSIFRSEVDDTAEPYFWSDDLLYAYLTDANVQYCRYGRPITDHTSHITTVDYEAGDPWVKYNEKILKIVSAFNLSSSNRALSILDWDEYQYITDINDKDYHTIAQFNAYPDKSGQIHTLVLNMDESRIRLVNIPETNGQLSLIVRRLPLRDVSANNPKLEGVLDHDKLLLLDWMKHKAYSNQDAETFDPNKAEVSRLLFLRNMQDVNSDYMKRSTKKRTMAYGGL